MTLERVRQSVRRTLGGTVSYRAAARVANTYFAVRREGLSGLSVLRMAHRRGPEASLRLRSLRHPFVVRPGSEDVATVVTNVFREEYGQLPATFHPTRIVDAGAYIGDTTAYFLTRFPDATVIALEPGRESYAQAVRNLAPYGERVTLLNRALWNSETHLRFSGSETAASVASSGALVETDTVPGIMRQFNLHTIDLLKIDIEGAEAVVIPAGAGAWLRRIRMLLLEIHGADIEGALIPLLRVEGFTCWQHRSVWYCRNTKIE